MLLLDIIHDIAVLLVINCEERETSWISLVRGGWFRFPLMIKFGRILIQTIRENNLESNNYTLLHEFDREVLKKLADVLISDVSNFCCYADLGLPVFHHSTYLRSE